MLPESPINDSCAEALSAWPASQSPQLASACFRVSRQQQTAQQPMMLRTTAAATLIARRQDIPLPLDVYL